MILMLMLAACGGEPDPAPGDEEDAAGNNDEPAGEAAGTIRLYTSVTQDTVDAVLTALREEHPDIEVELFRAPTGELNARLAAELRAGGVRADVIWQTDPLTMYAHDEQELLQFWRPEGVDAIPEEFRTETFWGTRILNMVIVHHQDVDPVPAGWQDLADNAYRDAVALPDPGFAGSAFAALGYFGLDPQFGMDYYESLRGNGAVQVQSIGDVITGVAEGRFAVGMALDKTVQEAIDAGSPIGMVWPEPGAIAIYSPIAVTATTTNEAAAHAFVEFVLTEDAQTAIGETGWQPIRDDVKGPAVPEGARQVFPDWPEAFARQDDLLNEYRAIFGG